MTDSFLTRLEQQLVTAEKSLIPRRRRWSRRVLRRATVVPIAIAITAVPALAATQPWDELAGSPGSQKLQAKARVPAAPSAEAPTVGVITYRSRSGLVCLAAGPIRDGRVGRFGPNGFRAVDAADAPGPCGDFTQNLADFGGIALAHSSPPDGDLSREQLIVYGLVAERSTIVRVTWPDGRTETAPVTPTASPEELQGAEGAFALAAAPDMTVGGTRIELLRDDLTPLHTFEL